MATVLTARVRRHVVDVDLSVDLDTSPVTVLFGPSGAGKTTILRCLAGLDRPAGRIALGEEVWDAPGVHVPPRRRHIGYLFQDHALFPHLDVDANVAYGLHRLPRAERADRVAQALALAGVEHLAGRTTATLSGGEAQRVALARALAPRPRLLLLDEPLSALDGPTRLRLRADLRRRLLAAGVPALVVTHDRTEALALGDRMAVVIDGRLHQLAAVPEVFSRPADPQVAAAVETETVVAGTIASVADGLARITVAGVELLGVAGDVASGDEVLVCIRAEEVALSAGERAGRTSPRNQMDATITAITQMGALLRIDLDAGFALAAYVTQTTREELELAPGRQVTAAVKAPAVHLIPRGGRSAPV